jgi:DNA recombination protein RmuC
LNQAQQCFEAARGKLVDGRGNLIGQVEKLKKLGARASKQLSTQAADDVDDAALPSIDADEGDDA